MKVNGWGQRVVLGAGGYRARVEVLETDTMNAETRLALPCGHSAYALAISPDGAELACGTRAGSIYWIAADGSGDEGARRRACQGAPVLSVCYVDQDHLASCDAAGRCFLWPPHSDAQPLSLPTKQYVVCSLLRLDACRLVGLSTTGALLFWRFPECELAEVIDLAPPAPLSALVNLIYWHAARKLAYPGRNGQLVAFDLSDTNTCVLPAHTGDFYACAEIEDQLLSIGLEDGRIACWRIGHLEPTTKSEAPAGVTSCALANANPLQLAVTHSDGSLSVCTFESPRLRVLARLGAAEYRVAVGLTWQQHGEFERLRLQREAAALAAAVESQLERREIDGIEESHARLSALGFRHVSLALRAAERRLASDPIGELRACAELASVLPFDAPEALEWLRRYAELLEQFWLLPQAHRLYSQYSGAASKPAGSLRGPVLADAASAMVRGDCVVEPDVPIPTLIDAADIVGTPFSGRFVALQLDPRPCLGVRLSPVEILGRYNQVRSPVAGGGLPECRSETLWHVRRNTCERIELLGIGSADAGEAAHLEVGLRAVDAQFQTAVETVVVFNALPRREGENVELHNRRVHECFHRLTDRSRFNGWIRPIRRAVSLTLRLLVTERLAEHNGRTD